jgi:hypothetical protein
MIVKVELLLQCRTCWPGTRDQNLVKGKIILCEDPEQGAVLGPLLAGAVGTVVPCIGVLTAASPFPLPAAYLSWQDGSNMYTYIKTTRY